MLMPCSKSPRILQRRHQRALAMATGPWGRGHLALARADRRACPSPPSNQCASRRIARARCPRPQGPVAGLTHSQALPHPLQCAAFRLASIGAHRHGHPTVAGYAGRAQGRFRHPLFLRGDGTRDYRALGGARHLPAVARQHAGQAALCVLRRPAVRDRVAASRAHPGVNPEGCGGALLDDEGEVRGPPLRLGLPRPAHRAGDRQEPRHVGGGGGGEVRRRRLQRPLPRHRRALCRRVAQDHHPSRPLGGLRQRLQDHGRLVHGVCLVGGPAALGQGPDLQGLQGHARFHLLADGAGQFRGGAELSRCHGPRSDGAVQVAGRGCISRGLDHHSLDPALESRRLRPCGHRLREGSRRRARQDHLSRRRAARALSVPAPRARSGRQHEGPRPRRPHLRAAVRLLR